MDNRFRDGRQRQFQRQFAASENSVRCRFSDSKQWQMAAAATGAAIRLRSATHGVPRFVHEGQGDSGGANRRNRLEIDSVPFSYLAFRVGLSCGRCRRNWKMARKTRSSQISLQ